MPWAPCSLKLEKGIERGGLLGRRVHLEPQKSEQLGWALQACCNPPFLPPTPQPSPACPHWHFLSILTLLLGLNAGKARALVYLVSERAVLPFPSFQPFHTEQPPPNLLALWLPPESARREEPMNPAAP